MSCIKILQVFTQRKACGLGPGLYLPLNVNTLSQDRIMENTSSERRALPKWGTFLSAWL
jgi:hypothetical protein